MHKREHTLFVEKYRSKELNEYVGNEEIKASIAKYLQQNDIQNFIFSGPPGTGKTTLAKLIVSKLNCDFIYINASDENGIDTIREKVQGFASAASFKPLKVVILDEADYLTINAQASLRNIIETFSRTTRFILTCNFVERIIDPLKSRCQVLNVVPPSKKEIAVHVADILDKENVTYELNELAHIVKLYYPDIRKILNTCQLNIIDNNLKLNEATLDSKYIDKIITELKSPSSTSWKTIRETIANSEIILFEELYKALYNNIETYSKGHEAEIILYIEQYQYESTAVPDKEICFMALIIQILNLIK
jgi:replication factor C small subunit